jgi:Heat induced stress protein YflT domain
MAESKSEQRKATYTAREVVGVFPGPDVLQEAVDELLTAGFNRAAISVLATDQAAQERLHRLYGTTDAAADDPKAPHAPYVFGDSRTEGKAAVIGVPFYIASLAGAAAVVASGGALAVALAAAAATGAAGAGLGALLVGTLSKQHSATVEEHLARGGLVAWVGVPDKAKEERALAVFRRCHAREVHVHAVTRTWGTEQRPLHDVQPDPFLEQAPRSA